MSTLELEHLKHSSASGNNITLAADGSITVNTTTLKVDATNNRVGVGTTSPGYPLQVNGSVDILNVKGSTGNAFVRFTDSDATADFSIGADDGSFAGSGSFILYDRSNSAYRLAVNSNGHVLKPTQPGFFAYNLPAVSAGNYVVGGTVQYNIGNHFNSSNGTFTVPVAGRYHFVAGLLTSAGTANSSLEMTININGSGLISGNESCGNNQHGSAVISVPLTLQANDSIRHYLISGTMHNGHSNNYFGCYLIG